MTAGQMEWGRVIKGVGGRYTVRTAQGVCHLCLPKGALKKHAQMTLTVGDVVRFLPESAAGEGYITEIFPRRTYLRRPPLSNLTRVFVVAAATTPAPSPLYLDKLFSVCSYAGIDACLVINKTKKDTAKAKQMQAVYEKAGYDVYLTNAVEPHGVDVLKPVLQTLREEDIVAFAGASGVGKSSLINALLPALQLPTGALSEKIARGKHTTRHVELFALPEIGQIACCPTNSSKTNDAQIMKQPSLQAEGLERKTAAKQKTTVDQSEPLVPEMSVSGFGAEGEEPVNIGGGPYLADTPGFGMLDLQHFDFFDRSELPGTFREFVPLLGTCRYTKCTHTVEEGCAIRAAVRRGDIAQCRHNSYCAMYAELKQKDAYPKTADKKI